MYKRIFVALTLILSIGMTSCGLQSMLKMDFRTFDKIEYQEENGETVLVYQNTEYRETDIFSCSKPPEEVSWHFNLPFSGAIYYYSYTTESPLYLWKNFGPEGVWLSENYNYNMDTFTIDDTEIEFVFSEMIDGDSITDSSICSSYDYGYNRFPHCVLQSKTAPNLYMRVVFINYLESWFMVSRSCGWRLSQEAVVLLKDSGII